MQLSEEKYVLTFQQLQWEPCSQLGMKGGSQAFGWVEARHLDILCVGGQFCIHMVESVFFFLQKNDAVISNKRSTVSMGNCLPYPQDVWVMCFRPIWMFRFPYFAFTGNEVILVAETLIQ